LRAAQGFGSIILLIRIEIFHTGLESGCS